MMESPQAFSCLEQARLRVLTDEDYASYLVSRGAHIKKQNGIFWVETVRGLWQPTHWLVKCDEDQAIPPTRLCWGFRCAIRNEAATHGGHLPVHLMGSVSDYDISALDGKRRNQLRACHNRAKIVQLLDSTLLENQGYEVLCSAHSRTGFGRVPSRAVYAEGVRRWMSKYPGVVLAGLIDEKVGGYLYGKAIGHTAYIDYICIATEALRNSIGTGLVFDFVQLCRQTGETTEVVYGLHTPEDPKLTAYKEGMLFPVVRMPAKVWMLPLVAMVFRMLKPHAFYRLTGRSSGNGLVRPRLPARSV